VGLGALQIVSGRADYSIANEASPFDLEEAVSAPYPFSTRSTKVVGEELVARGFIVATLGLNPPARIVEFGSGWGNLTIDLATMGFEVTAVEVERRFCDLTERRSRAGADSRLSTGACSSSPPTRGSTRRSSTSPSTTARTMWRCSATWPTSSGRCTVLWAGEPIAPMSYPWGLRLDGYSLWSIRTHGWLELGFDEGYFADALARTGWKGTRTRLPAGSPLADVIVATR